MSEQVERAVAELVAALRAEVATEPDRLLGVNEAAAALGIGRTTLYDLMAGGQVRSIKVGKRRLIPSAAVGEYIRSQPGAGAPA